VQLHVTGRREVDGRKRHLHLATGVDTLTKTGDTVLLALKLHRLSRGRTSAIGHLVTATTDPRLTSHAATADLRKDQRGERASRRRTRSLHVWISAGGDNVASATDAQRRNAMVAICYAQRVRFDATMQWLRSVTHAMFAIRSNKTCAIWRSTMVAICYAKRLRFDATRCGYDLTQRDVCDLTQRDRCGS
jgi:hypothetical protein